MIIQSKFAANYYKTNANDDCKILSQDSIITINKYMSFSESSSQHNGSYSKQLFDLLYYFPSTEEDLKDFKKVDSTIRHIIVTIKKLQKNNVEQIQRVCNTNKKLQIVAKCLFNEKLSILVINLFTHLVLSSKLLNFLIKINVPLIIYRNLIRILEKDCERGKNKIKINEKDKEIEESLKFILEYSRIEARKFPRSFANLVSNMLAQQSIGKNSISILSGLIFDISIQILKNNFVLGAESQILQNIYNKTISGDIDIDRMRIVMDIIVNACNSKQTRDIVHGSIDLGKAFARFNNVDLRLIKPGNSVVISNQQYEQKLIKSCLVIETLLSSWSTLIYFIVQKSSLMNFINGLVRKSPFQIQIIKTHILKKIIIRTLTYNKMRMLKSLNIFGYKSNYLNYRGLVLINFMLKNDNLYETFERISKEGQLMQSLSSLCLQYFPHISQNERYSKKIIRNIKFPRHYQTFIAKQAYKKKLQSYHQEILLSLKSFCKPSLISYYFEPKQLRNYLIWIKQNKTVFNHLSEQLREQIQINLEEVKVETQSTLFLDKNKILALLANFYKVGVYASYHIPWKGENLKFAKFLSSILQYLINNQYSPIFPVLFRTLKNMFQFPKVKYCRYLICTILDDFGRYLPTMQQCQSLILNNFKSDDHSFLISKILLNIDYEKSTDKFNKSKFQTQIMSPKKILEYICTKEGSDYVILSIIEVIKNIYYQNIDRNQHEPASLIKLLSTHLIYSKNQEVVSACLEFFEEAVMTRSASLEKYVKMIKLQKIKSDYHRKKFAYLFLVYEGGLEIVTETYPQIFKEELENWVSKGSPALKDYTNFMLKQVKRFNNVYTKQKEGSSYLFLGFEEEERENLLNLPWNVMIKDQCYPALAEYKSLKEKLKLRVRVSKVMEPQMPISVLNIGMNSFGKEAIEPNQNLNETVIVIRLEEVMKSFEKNKNKETKEQPPRFAVTKEQVTLFFTVDQNQNFILEKLNINIHLQKKIYRPLIHPLNFISLLTKTKSGMDFLKRQKTYQKIIEKISSSQNNFDILKQNLIFLGCYCSGYRELKDSIQKKEFYEGLMKGFWKTLMETTNYEIKQICHWIMNVVIKDEDFQNIIKSQKQKKGKFVETKYCGTLYYSYYCPAEGLNKQMEEYDNLGFIKQEMPEKMLHEAEYKDIYEGLLNNEQKQREFLNLQRIDDMRKKEYSNPKVFENIMKYMSLINYCFFKVHIVFEMFQGYLSSAKFENDFPNGFPLP